MGQWQPTAITCSALENRGVNEVWTKVEEFRAAMQKSGELDTNRSHQAKAWMWKEIRETLLARFSQHPEVQSRIAEKERKVEAGEHSPTEAAMGLIEVFFSPTKGDESA